jgi:LPXTG-motif cell wall-anchored protein
MGHQESLQSAKQKIDEVLQDLPGSSPTASVGKQLKSTQSLLEKVKDNIAYVLGLPAAITGAFGFLWDSSSDEAALQYQVDQLEAAVADLKAEGDLLGGGVKNWSLNPADAPGGSLTAILVAMGIIVLLGLLFWYQSRRKQRQ